MPSVAVQGIDVRDHKSCGCRVPLSHQLLQINVSGMSHNVEVVESAAGDLGVVIDDQVSLSAHISTLGGAARAQSKTRQMFLSLPFPPSLLPSPLFPSHAFLA